MANRDPNDTSRQIEELARMLYSEIQRQIDSNRPSTSAIIEAGSLRHVLIEGHIDLAKIAAALITRYDIAMPDIETVGTPSTIAQDGKRLLPDS